MPWTQLTVTTGADRAWLLARTLEGAGAEAVTFADAADSPVLEPAPGETRIWPTTQVIALFGAGIDLTPLRTALAPHLTAQEQASWQVQALADQAWERAWLAHFHPRRFGRRLWICPSSAATPDPGAVNILLDPGLAFGTGTHPTTALCLEWLDGSPPEGADVIDYGCGSGVLAVAAAKLGAHSVRAVDIDPQAITATADNAACNGVAGRIHAGSPQALDPRPADLLLANILSGPLIELAPRLSALVRPGGRIVLSGILREQAEAVQAAYATAFTLDAPAVREGWARLCGQRR